MHDQNEKFNKERATVTNKQILEMKNATELQNSIEFLKQTQPCRKKSK